MGGMCSPPLSRARCAVVLLAAALVVGPLQLLFSAPPALKRPPRVAAVVPDREVKLAAQTLPTGVDRVEADRNATAGIDGVDRRVDVDVAVIDGMVDLAHPDLNVWMWADCTGENASTPSLHGTHVAGTIGALDN